MSTLPLTSRPSLSVSSPGATASGAATPARRRAVELPSLPKPSVVVRLGAAHRREVGGVGLYGADGRISAPSARSTGLEGLSDALHAYWRGATA